jgi:O-antigen/teichoic acid export membrane protein
MSVDKNKLVSHTSIYMLGGILRRGVSLIMLPIYTRYLTPADYGVVELLSMLLDIATIIFSARVGGAIFRYYCGTESDTNKNTVISSALLLAILMNGLGTVFVIAFSTQLSIAIFSDPAYSSLIALFAITMLLTPLTEIPLVHIRAQQKPWLYLFFSTVRLVLQLSLNIYFVVMLDMHVLGVVYSAVITTLIIGIILTGYSLSRVGVSVSFNMMKSLFSFGLPLKLAALGSFYMAFGDRWFLNYYSGLTEVGIYSLGYKFGFILLLLAWDPFTKFWDSEKYEIYKRPDAKQTYQRIFLYTSSVLIFSGLLISLFTKDFIRIMSDPAFHDAYKVVPIIVVAYIFQAWTKYCNLGILIDYKTGEIAYSEMIAVGVISIGYLTLIPEFGMYGAAWATLAGFLARFLWTYMKSTRRYDMELPWRTIFIISVLAAITYLLSLLSPEDIIQSIFYRALLTAGFVAVFLALPVLDKREKQYLWRGLKRPSNLLNSRL